MTPPTSEAAAPASLVGTIFVYFASAGLFVFGSGLAIVPFLHDGVVQQYRWLTEQQFLDAVAVALVTPGPVVITVAFVGFLVAGALGAATAAAGVFAPVYVITVLLAPRCHRWKHDPRGRAFVDVPTALIAVATLALLHTKTIPEPVVVLGAGAVGTATRALAAA